MTATNPRDRETVRNLLRTNLPSAFPAAREPLTVGDVACRLVSEHARGAERLTADDLAASRALVTSPIVIEDERLTGRRTHAILALAAEGAELPERFWIKFQRAALEMRLGRNPGPAVVIACPHEEAAPDRAEHSDAPWWFDAAPSDAGSDALRGHILPHGAGEDDPCVAGVEEVGSADLALMLAAPEMLAVLESIHVDLVDYSKRLSGAYDTGAIALGSCADQAARVIAKARGQTDGTLPE